ncbi:MAG: response regulator [Elusimicrobiota bacterium]
MTSVDAVASNKKILVVDDDIDIVRLLTQALSQEGYVVESASQGSEVLRKTFEFLPDLILLDVMIPAPDGYHVAREITNDKTLKKKPIIYFITSRDTFKESKIMEFAGAAGVIPKPFSMTEIKTLIKGVLSKK